MTEQDEEFYEPTDSIAEFDEPDSPMNRPLWMRLKSAFTELPPVERMDRIIEALLIGLLAFGPLVFGIVHAWSEEVFVALGAAICLVFCIKLVAFPEVKFVWSWAYIPVIILLLIVVLQLVSLPASIVNVVSPETVSLRTELLGNSPGNMPLSFYPYATARSLRTLLVLAAVFVVVVNICRRSSRIKRLLAAIAIIGGAMALLALAQTIAGNGSIYWFIPTHDRAVSGTFINHSHYGQFMNLSIGAALGLLLIKLHEAFGRHRVTPKQFVEFITSEDARAIQLLTAVIVVGATTVFASLTRGGMISMLIAASFTTFVLSARKSYRGRGWIIVLIAFVAFVSLLYVGFEQVYDRLATMWNVHNAEGGRMQMAKDAFNAWMQFPVFGTGLSTYSVVYPMFDHGMTTHLATNAENEYTQTIIELGFAGLLALAVFGIIVWFKYSRSVGSMSIPICSAAYGLGFGLFAILIHSATDFGQHLPANATLSVVCCGLLICLAEIRLKYKNGASPRLQPVPARPGFSSTRTLVLLPMAAVWIWALMEADSARQGQVAWSRAQEAAAYLQDNNWQGEDDTYADLLTNATAASKAEPGNVHYRHWLNVYRWRSLERHTDPNTGQLPEETLPIVSRLVEEFDKTHALCPTFGPAYCLAGELQEFVLDDTNGAKNVHKGYRLAPADPTTCFAAAQVDFLEGDPNSAFAELERACQLDQSYFRQAATLCVDEMAHGGLAQRLAGDNPGRLAFVADLLAASDDQSDLAEQIKATAFALREKQCQEPNAPASAHAWLANSYRQKGDIQGAIEQYKRAVQKDYQQTSWHFTLAQLLADSNQVDDAIHELRICRRLRPDFQAAVKLEESLYKRSPATPQPLGAK